jgi:hypothetical protein
MTDNPPGNKEYPPDSCEREGQPPCIADMPDCELELVLYWAVRNRFGMVRDALHDEGFYVS